MNNPVRLDQLSLKPVALNHGGEHFMDAPRNIRNVQARDDLLQIN